MCILAQETDQSTVSMILLRHLFVVRKDDNEVGLFDQDSILKLSIRLDVECTKPMVDN